MKLNRIGRLVQWKDGEVVEDWDILNSRQLYLSPSRVEHVEQWPIAIDVGNFYFNFRKTWEYNSNVLEKHTGEIRLWADATKNSGLRDESTISPSHHLFSAKEETYEANEEERVG